jgi:hypothetical protein
MTPQVTKDRTGRSLVARRPAGSGSVRTDSVVDDRSASYDLAQPRRPRFEGGAPIPLNEFCSFAAFEKNLLIISFTYVTI